MQPAVSLICSTWPSGWPLEASQGFKVHCFTRAVLSADLCGSNALLLRIIADSCTLSSLPLLRWVIRVSIFFGELFPLIVSVWRCRLAGALLGGSRVPGLPWIPTLQLGIWHPASLLGTSSQAHLFVMSLHLFFTCVVHIASNIMW